MSQRMIVIAGPPGGGKSSAFPVSSFGTAYFNADDRAAEWNGGSYLAIPTLGKRGAPPSGRSPSEVALFIQSIQYLSKMTNLVILEQA